MRPGGAFLLSAGAAALAATAYAVFLDGLVAMPLRAASSAVAAGLLGLGGLEVSRAGTVLDVGGFRFGVEDACSGSNALTAMVALGIFWALARPGGTPLRRAAVALAAVPMALLANGARVAALVAASLVAGAPVLDGPLHAAIGVASFGAAAWTFLLCADRIAPAAPAPGAAASVRLGAGLAPTLVVLLLLHARFLWGVMVQVLPGAWDPWGWAAPLIFLAPLPLAVAWWRAAPDLAAPSPAGLALWLAALAASVAGHAIDLPTLSGCGLVAAGLALAWLRKGPRLALAVLPLAAATLLGFPKASVLVAAHGGLPPGPANVALRAALELAVLLPLAALLRRRLTGPPAPVPAPAPSALAGSIPMASSLAALALALLVAGAPGATPEREAARPPYLLGAWTGSDRTLRGEDLAYFGADRIWARTYARGGDEVELLVNSTGADRRRNHPPEYCQTAAGWVIRSSRRIELATADGPVAATRLDLERGADARVFVYWFSDGEVSCPGYAGMLLRDTLRRLGGRRTDWRLVRLGGPNAGVVEAFAAALALRPRG